MREKSAALLRRQNMCPVLLIFEEAFLFLLYVNIPNAFLFFPDKFHSVIIDFNSAGDIIIRTKTTIHLPFSTVIFHDQPYRIPVNRRLLRLVRSFILIVCRDNESEFPLKVFSLNLIKKIIVPVICSFLVRQMRCVQIASCL